MIRFKVYKLSQLVYMALVVVLVILLVVVAVRLWQGSRTTNEPVTQRIVQPVETPQTIEKPPQAASFFDAVAQTLPEITPNRSSAPSRGMERTDVELVTPQAVYLSESDIVEDEHLEAGDVTAEVQIQIAGITGNATVVSAPAGEPLVLIYHTHSREAYKPTEAEPYVKTVAWRTLDTQHSIIRVGDALTDALADLGVRTLHDRTDHETPYSKAYTRSLETTTQYKEDYASLQVFIDLHRDGYDEGTRKDSDLQVTYEGKTYAKIMFVVGMGEGYQNAPNWQENYKAAKQITDELDKLVPGIAKPILVRKERFNQHLSDKTLLIEVGSNLTTLEVALNSAPVLAQALSTIMK